MVAGCSQLEALQQQFMRLRQQQQEQQQKRLEEMIASSSHLLPPTSSQLSRFTNSSSVFQPVAPQMLDPAAASITPQQVHPRPVFNSLSQGGGAFNVPEVRGQGQQQGQVQPGVEQLLPGVRNLLQDFNKPH